MQRSGVGPLLACFRRSCRMSRMDGQAEDHGMKKTLWLELNLPGPDPHV